MSTSSSYSNLKGGSTNFDSMLRHFGVVTVMNAKVFNYTDLLAQFGANVENLEAYKCDEILAKLLDSNFKPLCELKTLKIANVTLDGPSKTVTGGQYANPLIKFGKTATMEIQDALGNADAIEYLGGGLVEHFHDKPSGSETHDDADDDGYRDVLHIGTDFASAKTILGETFFIDQKSGRQVPVTIIFYQFLPNSTFNLTQASDGDATVFDMNGDLLNTEILVSTDQSGQPVKHGLFYSVLPRLDKGEVYVNPYTVESGVITITPITGLTIKEIAANGIDTAAEDPATITCTEDATTGTVTVTTTADARASVDVVVFYTDGSMKTYPNIIVEVTA